MSDGMVHWTNGFLHLGLSTGAEGPVSLAWLDVGEVRSPAPTDGPALVEILTVEHGRARTSQRYGESELGQRLRYAGHEQYMDGRWHALAVTQRDPISGLEVKVVFRAAGGVRAFQVVTTVRNGGLEPVQLQAITSVALPVRHAGEALDANGLRLASGDSEWLGENRWKLEPLRDLLPDLNLRFHGQDQRGHLIRASTSSWSTGGPLPAAALVDARDHWCLMWQVENTGGWAYELSETRNGTNLALLGPTDDQHQWLHKLHPGEEFESAPASVALSREGLYGGLSEMTSHRRALRSNPAPAGPGVVYNDFMNTLMGDPTTAKLLPLVRSAKAAGADVFCIDAGWYDDGTDWWDCVGAWEPSSVRFPEGLEEVTQAIASHGMQVGMWMEPEVVGVRSPLADALPREAFLQRNGERVVEHGRYHLDFRHGDVVAHLNATVDRLVSDFGVSYFKFDYNITAGAGTDLGAVSAGAGLLGHNRAFLGWLDGVKSRHRGITIENCASGAMRQDYALLARLDLQSTSDQQDLLLYPPISANSFFSILPEQAAHWAYPQADMPDNEIRFTLATGMLGRMCLSGFLDRMTPPQLEAVRTSVAAHKALLPEIHASSAFHPSGIPRWQDQWLSVGLRAQSRDLVTVWNRGGAEGQLVLELPRWKGREVHIESIGFSGNFKFTWDTSGHLRVAATGPGPSAATFAVCAAG